MSKEITVSARTESGKGSCGRARKNGLIPAVVYGKGSEPVLVYLTQGEVDSDQLRLNEDVVLDLDGKKSAARVAEIQINYLKSHVVHIDFCLV